MYHLIKKDLLMQKRTLALSIIFIIFFTLTLSNIGPAGLTVSILGVTYMLALGASALEDKNNSDIILVSLPIKKNTIVFAKYLSIYVFVAYAALLNYFIYLLVDQLNLPINVLPFTFEGLIVAIVAVTLFCSITLPLIFKYGFIKSRMINLIFFFVFVSGGLTLVDNISQKETSVFFQRIIDFLSKYSDVQLMLLLMIPPTIILITSYFLSIFFYNKREF